MEEQLIIKENLSPNVLLIKFNRPKYLNAINKQLLKQLYEELLRIKSEKQISSIIITGEGEKAFIAGADINEIVNMTCSEAKAFSMFGQVVFDFIENYDKPIIAAINGFALGGGLELALSCDIRIASEKAKFSFPEINLGIMPGFGGTQRLTKIIGIAKAKEMIYTGKMINAYDAEKIGLVNYVVKDDELIENVKNFAQDLALKSKFALKLAKESINKSIETSKGAGMTLESNAFSLCFSTKNQKEGMLAFLEKRNPKFVNE